MKRRLGLLVFVSRNEALARILDTAIELWFGFGDPVSIHILACVAHQNLDKLGEARGSGGPVLKQTVTWENLYSAYESFKHSNGDPDHRDQFPSDNNTALLEDCVPAFKRIFGFHTPWMMTFGFHQTRHESTVKQRLSTLLPGVRIDDLAQLQMQQFANKVQPIFVRAYRQGLR